MYKSASWAGVVLTVFVILSVDLLWAQDGQVPKLERKGHHTVTGTVSKITGNLVTLKTKEGTLRNFSVKEAGQEGLIHFKTGDKVTLELDEGNQIIDIEKGTVAEQERNHYLVTGEVTQYDRAKKEVTLKMKSGEHGSYKLKDAAATKIGAVKPGTRILIEIDDENGMVSDFDVQ